MECHWCLGRDGETVLAVFDAQEIAGDTLDGAIHGVTNVWHPDTLEAVTKAMEEPNFWCRRSSDALIRAFGGAYVLGQQADKLVLVRGAPHTALTDKICLAHNLVYTAVHLIPTSDSRFQYDYSGLQPQRCWVSLSSRRC